MKTKKTMVFGALLLVCAGLFAQNVSLDQAVQTSAQAIETRLPKGAKTAVLTFTSTRQTFSDYIIEELATALSLNKNLQLIDRQHMDAIRKEFNVQFSGDVSDEEVKSIGKQLGAQYVVTGSIVDIGNAYRFRVAAINVESAVREGSPPLNININDPQVVFLLTGQRTSQAVTTPPVPQNPFVGRWQAINKSMENVDLICILNIKDDGTIKVERYDTYTQTATYSRNGKEVTNFSYSYYRNGSGTGTYTAITKTDNNTVQTTISLNITGIQVNNRSVSSIYTLNLKNPDSFHRVGSNNYFDNGLRIEKNHNGSIRSDSRTNNRWAFFGGHDFYRLN